MKMHLSIIEEFEKKVLLGLKNCGIDLEKYSKNNQSVGVAVSGGADSISLLISLSNILSKYDLPLFVISVNHFIRQAEETCGDVEFVKSICNQLNQKNSKIFFDVKEYGEGEILTFSQENKTGIEDAARKFRYQAFEEFIEKYNLSALCLAHNQNDQIETALMRFLQGGSQETLVGIPEVRDKYVRPLLQVSRDEIEAYLKAQNVTWRTDSTNFDTEYLRNKIRQNIVPFLNNEFPGWQKNVLRGLEKSENDKNLILSLVEDFNIQVEKNQNSEEVAAIIDKKHFDECKTALKINVLIKACNLIGIKNRIPYYFLNDFIVSCERKTSGNDVRKTFGELEIICEKDRLLIKKSENFNTDLVFFDIIERTGVFEFPFGKMEVSAVNEGTVQVFVNGEKIQKLLTLPFCVRNSQLDDEIQTSSGQFKKISDIFIDWHVKEELKKEIPVIQELSREQKIVCILGKILGYKDWIVK